MVKYLRQIEFRGFLHEATYDETNANHCDYFRSEPNFLTGFWSYTHHALPVHCDDVAKINFYGCENSSTRCDNPCLGIGSLWVELPANQGKTLDSCLLQQAFMVNLAHQGILFASNRYKFDFQPFAVAKELAEKNDYRFEYQIGKSKVSPDHRLKALIWCFFDNGFKTEVVFQNRDNSIAARVQFGRANEQIISDLTWIDSRSVRITTKDFNTSYWICTVDGTVEFHFGHAESDEPHHIYRHASILLDGTGVLPDYQRGLILLQRAADMGYKHAQRRLERCSVTGL